MNKQNNTSPLIVIFLCLIILGLTHLVWAQKSETHESIQHKHAISPRIDVDLLKEIKQRGKLQVGVAMIAPWAMHNKNGELIGFEIDVAKKLARDIGVEVEFNPVPFRELIADLLANRFDIIISGMSIRADRALKVNFTIPYQTVGLSLAASKKLAGNHKTFDSFNQPTITIGVVDGGTAKELASQIFSQASIRSYEYDSALFQDLIDGKIQAAVADSPRPELVAKFFPNEAFTPFNKSLASFPNALAVRRGDMDFVNFLNSWIQARTVNNWLEQRRNYWFNSTAWEKEL